MANGRDAGANGDDSGLNLQTYAYNAHLLKISCQVQY